MMLRPRVAVTSALMALPAALIVTMVAGRVRASDQQLALERVVRAQVNEQVRERCESDPTWFLTGPLEGRPKGGVFVETSPDQLPPRPKVVPQPYELFAYDEVFVGSSSASARFPPDFRRLLRSGTDTVFAAYETSAGTGVMMAMATGWTGSPCMYFMGRMEPLPNQRREQLTIFAGSYLLAFLVALFATTPTVMRVRRLARDAHVAVDNDYTAIGPDKLKDELSSLTFVYNDAANELGLRRARIDDQDVALKRFVSSTDEEVAQPLVALEAKVGALVSAGTAVAAADAADLLKQVHDLTTEVENLTAAARLRMQGVAPAVESVDVTAMLTRIVARHQPLADAARLSLELAAPPTAVQTKADTALFERAVANVVDNAIRYNRPGGHVRIALTVDGAAGMFRLRVSDDGQGVTEEAFKTLTAIRRFRGDEGRIRRPGAPGLGLAVAREAIDRMKLQMELRRPGASGFDVEFSGVV